MNYGVTLAVVIEAENYDEATDKADDLVNLMKQNTDIVQTVNITDGPEELES